MKGRLSPMPRPLLPSRGQEKVPVDPNKLIAYRRRRAWSQYELAKKSGVSRSYIGDIEQGKKLPRKLAAQALARALDLRVEDLKST